MKKQMFVLLIFLAQMALKSQNEGKTFNYLVGSDQVAGYSMITYTCDATKYKITEMTPAPILQVYKARKTEFVGGILENEKGKKTKIVDISLVAMNKNAQFTVIGKDFSRSFTLTDGVILKEEDKVSHFYTTNIGVWKIYKK